MFTSGCAKPVWSGSRVGHAQSEFGEFQALKRVALKPGMVYLWATKTPKLTLPIAHQMFIVHGGPLEGGRSDASQF